MNSRYSSYDYIKVLHWTDIATCIYLPLISSFIHSNGYYLRLGSFDSIFFTVGLALLEISKYAVYKINNKPHARKFSVKDFFKSIVVLVSVFVTIYVVVVLFGAPIFSNMEETCMLALLTTTLTALPICLYLGPDSAIKIFLSLTSYQNNGDINNLFMTKVRLSLFGVWLGAVVIPLDWNRPWQDWPIPCCMGLLFGHIIGNAVTVFLQMQQKRKSGKKTGKYAL